MLIIHYRPSVLFVGKVFMQALVGASGRLPLLKPSLCHPRSERFAMTDISERLYLERGLLIAFEGIDGSGKQSQSRLLKLKLENLGLTVERVALPDYSTPIGREIGEYLKAKRDFPPQVRQLLYAANRTCGLLARLYPEQTSGVAEVVRRLPPTGARRRGRAIRMEEQGHATGSHHLGAQPDRTASVCGAQVFRHRLGLTEENEHFESAEGDSR